MVCTAWCALARRRERGWPTDSVARMSWARRLPPPVRRVAARVVQGVWEWGCDAAAIGPDDERGRRFGAFGRSSVMAFPQGAIYNEQYIRIGAGTMIGPNVCLTAGMAPGQPMASDPVVRIGDRCIIGRGSHIVGHWSIEIGDDIQTGPYVYITDQNHSYEDPDEPVGRQWPVEAAVRIGSGSWLGANVVILPGSQIGAHVVVAAGAVVRGTIPDRCVVAGVPARIVRRWVPERGWVDVCDAGDP
jgi:acetyltransferase-like isoleucine patch superfamily enzyme